MKKLMFVAAAVLCGAVFAESEITSANVVGYQGQSLVNGDYNWICVNFEKVDGTTVKLGDFTVNENYSASALQFLDAGGATKKILLPEVSGITQEEVDCMFEWWTAEWLETETVVYGDKVNGWYLRDSNNNLYNMNATVVPFGKGIMVDCTDDDASFVISGGVSTQALPVDLVNGDYNWTGNATPRAITLSELTVNENYSASALQFLDAGGATKKILLPEVSGITQEEVDCMLEWWTAEWLETETVVYGEKVAGWYLRDSNNNLYNMNATAIPAGAGFMVDCTDDDAQIVLPAALTK